MFLKISSSSEMRISQESKCRQQEQVWTTTLLRTTRYAFPYLKINPPKNNGDKTTNSFQIGENLSKS